MKKVLREYTWSNTFLFPSKSTMTYLWNRILLVTVQNCPFFAFIQEHQKYLFNIKIHQEINSIIQNLLMKI